MGFEQTIQRLSQAVWPGTLDPDSAKQKSAEGRARAFNPAGAKTPEEALTYIERLYKAGRTDELAELLRRSPVFRDAWQSLQQFSSTASEAGGGLASSIPAAAPTPDQSGLPASPAGAGPSGQLQSPGQDLATPQVTATQEFSQKILADQTYPVLASRPTRFLGAVRQVYETQARYYAQEGTNFPRISIRV